jgi:hypothetical protein
MIVRELGQERQATAWYSTVEELLPSFHRVDLASAWQLVFVPPESCAGSMPADVVLVSFLRASVGRMEDGSL